MQRKTIITLVNGDEIVRPSLAAAIRFFTGRGRGDVGYETLYKDIARRVHRGEDRVFRFA